MDGLVHAVAVAVVVATVILSGQPIYANDTWIHLALGEVFAEHGPWLASDPFLFAAPRPPDPSSWLGSVAIHWVQAIFGFTGLRLAHALSVLVILGLAWRLIRRAGAAPGAASAGLIGFVALSTYRLVQLRPDLFTIAATLALAPLLFERREGPDARRIAVAAVLAAVWANVHAAFLLAPALTLAASVAVAIAALLPDAGRGSETGVGSERDRALRLAGAAIAMGVASLANPKGLGAYRAYFESGRDTLALEAVADEWNPTNLFAWPIPMLPPTWAAWLVCWLCVVAVAVGIGLFLRERRLPALDRAKRIDPVLLALAGSGLFAAVRASRFLWLGIFALALLASLVSRGRNRIDEPVAGAAIRADRPAPPGVDRRRWTSGGPAVAPASRIAVVAFALATAALHFSVGDWSIVSRALAAEGADYRAPYPAERYNTHAIWFLADTGVEGRIFNEYPLGGFMSFWLGPRLQMASSGTMNVAKEAMEANLAIASRQQVRAGEDYAALLDHQGFDLFLGTGFPVEATPGRPIPCTVRHLEHEPGWMLVFRNLRSAVYLRRNPRNAENLAKIADYYARAGIPFDTERGVELDHVVHGATGWAIEHGLVPRDFPALLAQARTERGENRAGPASARLAVIYATVGLYERALEVDLAIQERDPSDASSGWRVLWELAQLGRWDEAVAFASTLEGRIAAAGTGETSQWSATLRQIRAAPQSVRATLAAHLPMLRPEQLDWVLRDVALSPARTTRPARVH